MRGSGSDATVMNGNDLRRSGRDPEFVAYVPGGALSWATSNAAWRTPVRAAGSGGLGIGRRARVVVIGHPTHSVGQLNGDNPCACLNGRQTLYSASMLMSALAFQYGLEVPIVQAGMAFLGMPPLVIAVSKAGGPGDLGAAMVPRRGCEP